MRILFVTQTLPHDEAGGSQTYVAELATTLAAAHEIGVLSGSRAGATGLPIRTVRRLAPLAAEASTLDKMWWHARDQWSLRQHQLIRGELRRFAPDVVHTHQCQGLTSAVFSAIAASGLPHVHTAHDLNVLCVNTRMIRHGTRCAGRCGPCLLQRGIRGSLVAQRLDFLIAPSDRVRRLHVSAGVVSEDRAVTIRQGAKPGASYLRGSDDRPLRAGFIGALAAHKGVRQLLAAVGSSRRSWTLDVVGSGPLAADVAVAARNNDRITFHGALFDADKDSFYAGVDLLVVPSEGEENAPLVVAEASVRGIPTVVSDRGGLAETALATVVRGGDPQALAEAIDDLDRDRERLRMLSGLLLERVDEFTWRRHVDEVASVLDRARSPTRAASQPLLAARRAIQVLSRRR